MGTSFQKSIPLRHTLHSLTLLSFRQPYLMLFSLQPSLSTSLCALAAASIAINGVRPELTDEHLIRIDNGCHPLHKMACGNTIRNSFYSNADDCEWITVVTGPNASGKSVYLNEVEFWQKKLGILHCTF